MKNLILIIITFSVFINTHAQEIAYQARFEVSYPDLSTKAFFDKYPGFDRISITYQNDTAVRVKMYADPANEWNPNKTYELSFEGDRYLLAKEYEMLTVPSPPKLTMESFEGISKQSRTGYSLTSTFRRGSVRHLFSYYTITGPGDDPKKASYNQAKFKGDFLAFQKKLGLNVKQWKPIPALDSILIITGIVDRNGALGNIQQKIGNPSQFSKKVIEFIEHEANVWYPVWAGTRTVMYRVKFFIRFNADESVTVSVL